MWIALRRFALPRPARHGRYDVGTSPALKLREMDTLRAKRRTYRKDSMISVAGHTGGQTYPVGKPRIIGIGNGQAIAPARGHVSGLRGLLCAWLDTRLTQTIHFQYPHISFELGAFRPVLC
jgi:hypothetical protein